ncbi:hypothetical protein F7725_001380 [Dissostichus mawsoni]|uniref:Uncharacterized protein n=1 Tax=Dissostichus mawsoni TaxID=36200 RepID=A0A7J5ZH62_DISMA|nr:hypothetical protein F7725_001380 [Dissostichus mawsoni]
MAAGSLGAVAAIYLCMIVLNLGPLFGCTTRRLAPLLAARLHTPPAGFRRGWLAEQLAPPVGLCGLALTAADLTAGPLSTPSEDYGSAPKAGSRVAEIHTQPSNFRRGRIAPTPSENCGSAPRASGLEVETHASPAGFRRGKLSEQPALPTGLCGLALTATGLAAGSIATPSEDWGPAPKAKGIAAVIHASPAGYRRGKLAEQLALTGDCGSAPMASSLATENHKPTASSVCSTVNNGTELAARLHTPPAGFRRGWLAEQLAPPVGLCGLALTAADLTAGPLSTPSEDYGRGRIAPTPSENCGSAPRASGLEVETHASPAGFRRGKLSEQPALPTGLCGLALTATGLAAGSIATPSEDWGPAPKAKGIAAVIHASPAGYRRGKLAEQLALTGDCGSAPMASSLATENHKPTASSVCSTVNNGTERNLPDFLSFLYQPVDCSLCEGLGKTFRENPKDVKFIYKVPGVSSAALQPAV